MMSALAHSNTTEDTMKAAFIMRHERKAAEAWMANASKTGAGAARAIKAMGYSHSQSTAVDDIARADFLAREIVAAFAKVGA